MNRQECEILYWHDLPDYAKDNYDHDDCENDIYFEYQDYHYCLSEFMRSDNGEYGYLNLTVFSAIKVTIIDTDTLSVELITH